MQILDTIGHKLGESRAEVRTAIDFFEAVETLAKEARPASKSLLLGGRNPYLTPALILELHIVLQDRSGGPWHRRPSAVIHLLGLCPPARRPSW